MPGREWGTEVQAQAMALLRQGETVPAIARRLGVPERTVQRWRERWREMAGETNEDRLLTDDDYRLAHRAAQILHQWIDEVEDQGGPISIQQATVANIIRGTASDKIRERVRVEILQRQPPVQQGPFVVFLAPEAAPEDAPAIQHRLLSGGEDGVVGGTARVVEGDDAGR